MINFKKKFELKPSLSVQIERITISRGMFDGYKLIPIMNDAYFYMGIKIDKDPLFLPTLYAALICLTGPGDCSYDHYKGSYSFSFRLGVQKNEMFSEYYYHIYHYRSYIEFSVFHIVSENDPRDRNAMVKPNDLLFSGEDIYRFSNYFCNYALGYMEGFKYTPEPFVKHSDSNLLLFGYSKNKYFFKSYHDPDQYMKAKNRLIKRVEKKEEIRP